MRNRLTRFVSAFLALFIGNNNIRLAVMWAFDLLLIIFGLAVVGVGGEVERTALDGLPASFRGLMTAYDPSLAPGYMSRFWAWINSWVWIPGYWQVVGIWTLICLLYIPIAFSDETLAIITAIARKFSSRKKTDGASPPARGGDAPKGPVPTEEAPRAFKGKGPWLAVLGALGLTAADEALEWWSGRKARKVVKRIAGGE